MCSPPVKGKYNITLAIYKVLCKRVTGKSEDELKKEFLSIIPLGRYETPQDVANLVLFLASKHAAYMIG